MLVRHSTSGSVISSSEVDQLPKKVKDADELFITDLISQIDDNEEYLMLTTVHIEVCQYCFFFCNL